VIFCEIYGIGSELNILRDSSLIYVHINLVFIAGDFIQRSQNFMTDIMAYLKAKII